MKQPLHLILVNHLYAVHFGTDRWVNSGELERLAMSHHAKPSAADRRMREVTDKDHKNYNPHIQGRIEKGVKEYRYV